MNLKKNITRREFTRQSSLNRLVAAIPSLAHRVAGRNIPTS